jgi:hypothetical protein
MNKIKDMYIHVPKIDTWKAKNLMAGAIGAYYKTIITCIFHILDVLVKSTSI